MGAIKIDIKQGSPEWVAWRKEGIGASDVPAIVGLSPYITANKLWKIKKNIGPDYEISEFAKMMGSLSEDDATEQFFDITGERFEPACFESSENPRFKCSLDGFYNGKILETKFVGNDYFKKLAAGGEIRQDHYAQLQWQMHIMNAPNAYYFCINKSSERQYVLVERHQEYIDSLVSNVEEFIIMLDENKEPVASDRDYVDVSNNYILNENLTKMASLKLQISQLEAQFEDCKKIAIESAVHNKMEIPAVSVKFYSQTKGQKISWYFKVGE